MANKPINTIPNKADVGDEDLLYIGDYNSGSGYLDKNIVATEVKKVKVSDNDTTHGVLNDKIDVTAALSKAIENASSDELLRLGISISADSGNILEQRSDGLYTNGNSVIEGYSVPYKNLQFSVVTTSTTNDTIRLSYDVLVVGTRRYTSNTIDFVMPTNLDPASSQTNSQWYELRVRDNSGTLEAYLLMEGDTPTVTGNDVLTVGDAYFSGSGQFDVTKIYSAFQTNHKIFLDLISAGKILVNGTLNTLTLKDTLPPKAISAQIAYVITSGSAGSNATFYRQGTVNITGQQQTQATSQPIGNNSEIELNANRQADYFFTNGMTVTANLTGFKQQLRD